MSRRAVVPCGLAAPLLAVSLASGTPEEAASARAPVELVFETESARATLNVFTGIRPSTPEEIARVVRLKGNQASIRHAESFRPSWNEASFREALGKAARSEPLGDDPWAFGIVHERLEDTRRLLRRIETDPKAFSMPVVARLALFVPAGAAVHVTVHVIVGGSSDGFAPADDEFYVALHYFRGDEEGLRVMMSHELFHVLRGKLAGSRENEPAPPNVTAARMLIDNTMNEGVASWIGDPTRATLRGPYIKWFAQKYKHNLDRIDQNTTLFDTLLFRAWNDPGVTAGALYPLGFSGGWESPLYYVGYAMASFLEKTEGADAVAAAVREGASGFFARYLEAAKKHPGAPITFTASTEEILGKLRGPIAPSQSP